MTTRLLPSTRLRRAGPVIRLSHSRNTLRGLTKIQQPEVELKSMLASIGVDLPTAILLVLALGRALSFEFVNGFHDTDYAVATVIYSNSLRPGYAVVWSGCWNLIGVLTSSGAVAFGIVALLPVELVINVGSGAGFAMVFSLLLSALIWNVGTWYLGLPASSSHTLIGSIVGVGLMNSLLSPDSAFGDGVNWTKVADPVKALVVSPLVGFALAALLLIIAKKVLSNKALFQAPEGKAPPPMWIRALLVLTCTGVSFAHGSNDGQKGMGLIVLILVGIVPTAFALNMATAAATIQQIHAHAIVVEQKLAAGQTVPLDAAHKTLTEYLRHGQAQPETLTALGATAGFVNHDLENVKDFNAIPGDQRRALRLNINLVSDTLARMIKAKKLPAQLDADATGKYQSTLKGVTNFIPNWVKFAVTLAQNKNTMIGWKRIVGTVGEKIC